MPAFILAGIHAVPQTRFSLGCVFVKWTAARESLLALSQQEQDKQLRQRDSETDQNPVTQTTPLLSIVRLCSSEDKIRTWTRRCGELIEANQSCHLGFAVNIKSQDELGLKRKENPFKCRLHVVLLQQGEVTFWSQTNDSVLWPFYVREREKRVSSVSTWAARERWECWSADQMLALMRFSSFYNVQWLISSLGFSLLLIGEKKQGLCSILLTTTCSDRTEQCRGGGGLIHEIYISVYIGSVEHCMFGGFCRDEVDKKVPSCGHSYNSGGK